MDYKTTLIEVLGDSSIGQVFYTFARYPDGRRCFLYISPNMKEYTDASVDEMMDDYKLAYRLVNPDQIQGMAEAQEESYTNLTLFYYELELIKDNGRKYWININALPERLEDGTVIWHGVQSDITAVKKQAKQVVKMNNDLALLNAVNDIILMSNNKPELFQRICDCLVEKGKYRLSWIAQKPEDSDPDQTIRRLAHCGATEYMLSVTLDLNNPQHRQGPTAQALLNKSAVITNNVNVSEYFSPWLEKAKENQIAGSAVFPFIVDDTVFALNIYSNRYNAFKDHEKEILERIAKNLALAVGRIRRNRENSELNLLLKNRVKELNALSSIQEAFQTEYSIDHCLQRIAALLIDGLQYSENARVEILHCGQKYITGSEKAVVQSFSKSIELANSSFVEIIVSYTESERNKFEYSFSPEEHELILTVLRGIKLFANELLLVENLKITGTNLNAVFKNTDVSYALLDLNGTIVTHNNQFLLLTERLTKVRFKKGMDMIEPLTNERYQIFKDSFYEVLATRESRSYESKYIFDNEEEYFIISIAPVIENNEFVNVCVTIKEVTEIKRSEAESKRMTNDLIVRNRDLEQFSFMVSHNLRAPVVNIIGLCSHLNDDLDDAEFKFIVESLSSSTERLVNVIDDLNTILMVKKDEHSVLEAVDLNLILKELVYYFTRVEDRRKPIINVRLQEESIIHGSAPFIESILYNLIGNAIKYTKHNEVPNIKVWTEVKDQNIYIHVRDNGIGIDIEKDGNKLFQLYTQLNTDIKGKGLGLYMVKSQAQLLGGQVMVKSEKGVGSEFIVALPIGEKSHD